MLTGSCSDRPGYQSGRIDCGLSGQGPNRPLRRGHLHTRLRPPRLSSRPPDVRRRDLPRRLAVSGDCPLGRTAWCTRCVSPAPRGSGSRFIPAGGFRRSCKYISRKGGPVPRRREHLLFRDRQFRESRLSDHVGNRPSGWDAAYLPALRRGRIAHRRHRHFQGDRPARRTLQNCLVTA